MLLQPVQNVEGQLAIMHAGFDQTKRAGRDTLQPMRELEREHLAKEAACADAGVEIAATTDGIADCWRIRPVGSRQ